VIFIGLGGNLNSAVGAPLLTLQAALKAMPEMEIEVHRISPWYRSAPWPTSDQPWFVNGVADVVTSLTPLDLMERLHELETRFGRVRSVPNAARTIDLDLLAFDDELWSGVVNIPHPRLQDRDFVLAPLADLAPGWRHPLLGKTATELLAGLQQSQGLERISGL
jgi:2-amino-4-hydroxy-6-hydroxymethyldihydropteridine diphosphokinase